MTPHGPGREAPRGLSGIVQSRPLQESPCTPLPVRTWVGFGSPSCPKGNDGQCLSPQLQVSLTCPLAPTTLGPLTFTMGQAACGTGEEPRGPSVWRWSPERDDEDLPVFPEHVEACGHEDVSSHQISTQVPPSPYSQGRSLHCPHALPPASVPASFIEGLRSYDTCRIRAMNPPGRADPRRQTGPGSYLPSDSCYII